MTEGTRDKSSPKEVSFVQANPEGTLRSEHVHGVLLLLGDPSADPEHVDGIT